MVAHSISPNDLVAQLLGRAASHLQDVPEAAAPPNIAAPIRLHEETLPALLQMREAASADGIDLVVASGWRSFSRQLAIWNAKALGLRPCFNDAGMPVDFSCLMPIEKIKAILRYSALPGASRHHWGTDMDLYDRAAVPESYRLALTADEYGSGGPFQNLHCWLQEHAAEWGFGFPYALDRGGIAPEPWHLSHLPVARGYEALLSVEVLKDALADAECELELKSQVIDHLPMIFERYIQIP